MQGTRDACVGAAESLDEQVIVVGVACMRSDQVYRMYLYLQMQTSIRHQQKVAAHETAKGPLSKPRVLDPRFCYIGKPGGSLNGNCEQHMRGHT